MGWQKQGQSSTRGSWGLSLQDLWARDWTSICLSVLVPGVKPGSQETLHRRKGSGADGGEKRPAWAVVAVFPHSLSLEGCFAPENSQNLFWINSLNLKPRENVLGAMASESPVLSAFSPQFCSAEALGLQEVL